MIQGRTQSHLDIDTLHAQQTKAHKQRLANAEPKENKNERGSTQDDRTLKERASKPYKDENRCHKQRKHRKGSEQPASFTSSRQSSSCASSLYVSDLLLSPTIRQVHVDPPARKEEHHGENRKHHGQDAQRARHDDAQHRQNQRNNRGYNEQSGNCV